jgi:hypothetical protein
MRSETIRLLSTNGEVIRHISHLEAQRLVNNEQAEAVTKGNWRNRRDVAWQAVQLVLPKDTHQSPCSISAAEMRVNAGAYSAHHSPAYVKSVREKVKAWPFIGDTKAVAVRPRA